MKIQLGYEGWKTVEVIKDGEVVNKIGPYRNMILDSGLDLLGGYSSDFADYMVAGTGNSEPSPSQTQLDSKLGGSARSTGGSISRNDVESYVAFTRTYTGAVGAFVGNFSEIGIGPNASGTNLFSRSLLRDVEGNPTSITVLADEQLRVTYELRMYQPTGDTFVGELGGYEVTIRPMLVEDISDGGSWQYWTWGMLMGVGSNSLPIGSPLQSGTNANAGSLRLYSGEIGPITGGPSGTMQTPNARTMVSRSYTPGSFEMEVTFNIPIGSGNFAGGLGAIALSMGGTLFQFGFSPKLNKTSENRLIFTVVYSWGRREE